MSRIAAWFGIAAGAVYLVFIGGAWWGIYTSGLRIVTVSIAALALAGWAALAWRRPEWRPRSVLLPAILAALASLAISTVFSRVPRVSVEYLAYSIVLAACYLLLVRLFASPFFRVRLVGLATLLFAVTSLAFVVLVVAHWVRWWSVLGKLAVPPLRPEFEGLTYGNPSAVLTVVALLAVPTAAALGSSSRRGSIALATIGVVIAIVALLSGSRAGWLALALAGGSGTALWLAHPSHRQSVTATLAVLKSTSRGRVAMVSVACLMLVSAVVLAPAIARRASEGGEDLRATYAVIALRLFAQSPLVGTGPGTWVIQRIHETRPPEIDYYIPHAHDVPVQTMAELGVIGLAAGALLLISLGRLVAQAVLIDDPTRRRWGWLTGLGLLYFGIHQLLDFYANMPAVLFVAAIPVAYLDGTRRSSPAGSRIAAALTRAQAVALGALVASISFLTWQEIPAMTAASAVADANAGSWEIAAPAARAAAAEDPMISPYQMTAGLMADRVGDHPSAAMYFERVAQMDDLPEAWLNLAAEQAAMGNVTGATASLRAALRVGSKRVAVAMPAGDLALRIGETRLAFDAFSAAISQAPSLAADPWWAREPMRRAMLDLVTEDLISGGPLSGRWEIALMGGDIDRAARLSASSGNSQLAADVSRAWAGDSTAKQKVFVYCQGHPFDIHALGWCARLESRDGHVLRASGFRYLANAQVGGAFAFGAELRVRAEPVIGQALGGDPATYWGLFTYRRSTPYDMLIGSLVHLTLE
jgi:O-antigen ligase